MELRKHIGEKLKHHRVFEGACYSKGVYTLIFGNMRKKTSVLVRLNKQMEVLGISEPMKIGHGNDCCQRGDTIYIVASGKTNKIFRVDAQTLKKKKSVKVKGCKGGFNGIACFGVGFIVRKMHTRKFYILDADMKKVRTIIIPKRLTHEQGIEWHNGKLYCAASRWQSTKNRIGVYDGKGRPIKRYHYKKKCELENVMIVDGRIVFGIYKKYRNKGKKHFEAYLKGVKT